MRADQGAERILALTTDGLDLAARAIEGDRAAAAELPAHMDEAELGHRRACADARGLGAGAVAAAGRRWPGSSAPIGALAVSAGEGSGLRDRRPRPRTNRPIERFRAGLASLRANASLESPAGRHAVRLAVVVLVAELISRHLPLSRSYWMVVAAATTLRPEFGATFTRGAERARRDRARRRAGGSDRGRAAPGRGRDRAPGRRARVGRVRRCSRRASRSVSRSSPRSSCSC